MADIEITVLRASPETRALLSEILIEVVANGGSARLYARLGFTLTGEIPDYALKPHGGLTSTLIFRKRIGPCGLLNLS